MVKMDPMPTRRSFLAQLATAIVAAPLLGTEARPRIKLGYDNFAVRGMGWKAPQLIDYAAQLKCDTLFISDLVSYDSLDDVALADVKAKADDAGVELYVGGWSICPTSKSFKPDWGTADEHLRLGLRVAEKLGSPVFRAVLGSAADRQTEGGIRARMADTIKVLKNCRSYANDRGVKIAIENHAGDMHSWELRDLIEEAGPDFVGANLDSGNATWTLEDPQEVLEILGPHTLCSSLRDSMVWETPDGASVAWTAAGDGLIDWKKFTTRWAELCPNVPIQIETLSGFSRNFPYKNAEFWKNDDKRPEMLAKFELLASRGHSIPNFRAPEGIDSTVAQQEYQKSELERSIRYLREVVGIGVRA